MPYFLAPAIKKTSPGLWAEGVPYSTEVLYDICSGDLAKPPVHYEEHTLKPHSICHFDAPGHIIHGGKLIHEMYLESPQTFYGPAIVAVIDRPNFRAHAKATGIAHWEISLAELKGALSRLAHRNPITKLILSFPNISPGFYQNETQAMTLSIEAANYLVSLPGFNLLGTPWKSADFQPGSRERPIHKLLFPSVGILECLNVAEIPEGEYFLSAAPIPLHRATESPAAPILFTREEVSF